MTDDAGNIVVVNQRPAALVVDKLTPLLKKVLQLYFGDQDILQVKISLNNNDLIQSNFSAFVTFSTNQSKQWWSMLRK